MELFSWENPKKNIGIIFPQKAKFKLEQSAGGQKE
jgi:hypothetical protein